jgi:hypothetical protein
MAVNGNQDRASEMAEASRQRVIGAETGQDGRRVYAHSLRRTDGVSGRLGCVKPSSTWGVDIVIDSVCGEGILPVCASDFFCR